MPARRALRGPILANWWCAGLCPASGDQFLRIGGAPGFALLLGAWPLATLGNAVCARFWERSLCSLLGFPRSGTSQRGHTVAPLPEASLLAFPAAKRPSTRLRRCSPSSPWGAPQQWSVAERSSGAKASLLSSSAAFRQRPPAVPPSSPWGAPQQ